VSFVTTGPQMTPAPFATSSTGGRAVTDSLLEGQLALEDGELKLDV